MTIRSELKTLRSLALPVVAAQVGTMMLGIFDMMMLGHHDTQALAASAIARVWISGTVIVAYGVLLGLDPRISQAHGAGKTTSLGSMLQGGLVLSLLLWVPLTIAWLFTGKLLGLMGVDSELAGMANRYVLIQIPGIPFLLGYQVLRSWLQGRGIMRPAMWIVLGANVLNVIANWVLIFGHLGFESRGIVGAGLATTLTQVFMFCALLLFVRVFGLHENAWTPWSKAAWPEARAILRLGIPVGLQFAFEIWAFQFATLMAERLGTLQLASHSIVLNLASITFMIPLGVSIGASTRVGNLIGAKNYRDAQTATWAALTMGGGAMLLASVVFILGRDQLPILFNTDPRVIAGAAAILPIAAAFQLFDGLQVVAGGVVRGMGRTRILALAHLFAFYILGLPAAYYLGFIEHLGLAGIWWGLSIGIASVAAILCVLVIRRGPGSLIPVSTALQSD